MRNISQKFKNRQLMNLSQTLNYDLQYLDLQSMKADDILDQLSDLCGESDRDYLMVFPNIPFVRDLLSDQVVKENRFWIITTHKIAKSSYEVLDEKNLVPYYGHGYNYQGMVEQYYKPKTY